MLKGLNKYDLQQRRKIKVTKSEPDTLSSKEKASLVEKPIKHERVKSEAKVRVVYRKRKVKDQHTPSLTSYNVVYRKVFLRGYSTFFKELTHCSRTYELRGQGGKWNFYVKINFKIQTCLFI